MSFLLEKGADLTITLDKGHILHFIACPSCFTSLLAPRPLRLEEILHRTVIEDIIAFLVDRGIDVNAKNSEGNTPLHIACESGNFYVAEALMKYGTDSNIRNKEGNTPLHLACKGRDAHASVACSMLLLENGADVNAKNSKGQTPLHFAASQANFELVKLLLRYGANILEKDEDGRSPIYYAVEAGDRQVLRFLVENGASIYEEDKEGYTPAGYAAKIDKWEIVKFFIDELNFDPHTEPFIHIWALNLRDKGKELENRLKVLDYLLSKGLDINETIGREQIAPIHIVAMEDRWEYIAELEKRGADIQLTNKKGYNAFSYAVFYQSYKTAKFLLNKKVDPILVYAVVKKGHA